MPSPFDGWTVASALPWKMIVRIAGPAEVRTGAPAPCPAIAAKAEGTSFADPAGRPEWAPATLKTSG